MTDGTVHVDVDRAGAGHHLLLPVPRARRATRRSGAPAPCPTRPTTCGSPWSRARSSTPASSTRTRASRERTDLDFLLHLGDYIYEASNTPPKSQTPGADIGRPFDPLHECVTLDDYRTRYRQYRRDPDVQRLHAAHPVIATLDDHEFADGAWRDGATEHKPEYGPWAERRANAFRAREEWLPVRRVDPARPGAGVAPSADRRPGRPLPHRHPHAARRAGARAGDAAIPRAPRSAPSSARGCFGDSPRRRRAGGCSPTRRSWARPGTPTLPDAVRDGLRKVKLHRRRHAGSRLRPVGRLPGRARRVLRPHHRPRHGQRRRAERRRARVARARAAPQPVRLAPTTRSPSSS